MKKSTVIIIPARYGSKRFPGKPLFPICGVPLLERVYRIASKTSADEVMVATDDERIRELVSSFGGKCVMTSPECANGSERVLEALQSLSKEPDIVLNLQGDALLTPPWVLEALIDEMRGGAAVATPAVRLTKENTEALQKAKLAGNNSGTLVVFDSDHRAMYFSRSIIPFVRTEQDPWPVFRHIGLYAYTTKTLREYVKLPKGRLEAVEQLEQLRFLENGIALKVVEVDYRGRTHYAIDTPEDVKIAEEIIQREGELV